jgi:hypothetical protein
MVPTPLCNMKVVRDEGNRQNTDGVLCSSTTIKTMVWIQSYFVLNFVHTNHILHWILGCFVLLSCIRNLVWRGSVVPVHRGHQFTVWKKRLSENAHLENIYKASPLPNPTWFPPPPCFVCATIASEPARRSRGAIAPPPPATSPAPEPPAVPALAALPPPWAPPLHPVRLVSSRLWPVDDLCRLIWL